VVIPRELRRGSKPFDPIELSQELESIVCRRVGARVLRKYSRIAFVRFYRGAATAFVAGCNLRCFFCWADESRDYPERYGSFYSAEEVVERLRSLARRRRASLARLSGGEPTICWSHLLEVLKLLEDESVFRTVLLETNGVLLGTRPELVKDLKGFSKLVVRVSIKAGTPNAFEERTGALRQFFEAPFRALEALVTSGVDCYPAALTDPRIVSELERREIFKRLSSISESLCLDLEEEVIEPFPHARRRIRIYGADIL